MMIQFACTWFNIYSTVLCPVPFHGENFILHRRHWYQNSQHTYTHTQFVFLKVKKIFPRLLSQHTDLLVRIEMLRFFYFFFQKFNVYSPFSFPELISRIWLFVRCFHTETMIWWQVRIKPKKWVTYIYIFFLLSLANVLPLTFCYFFFIFSFRVYETVCFSL